MCNGFSKPHNPRILLTHHILRRIFTQKVASFALKISKIRFINLLPLFSIIVLYSIKQWIFKTFCKDTTSNTPLSISLTFFNIIDKKKCIATTAPHFLKTSLNN